MGLVKITDKAKDYAVSEINKFNAPAIFLFNISLVKGQELSRKLGADAEIVYLGCCLMDIKLGECLEHGRVNEHIVESEKAASIFLDSYDYPTEKKKKVLECIREHHGKEKFSSIESEICCNSDCYRFLVPAAIVDYITVLGERKTSIPDLVKQVEFKVDEKWNALSLDICKKELKKNHELIKNFLNAAKN